MSNTLSDISNNQIVNINQILDTDEIVDTNHVLANEINFDEELYRGLPPPEQRIPPYVCRQNAFAQDIAFI
tara:strand:+ start:244 stop:456 length:213 start_codon:yes stop_codon:yes gene_type:complete